MVELVVVQGKPRTSWRVLLILIAVIALLKALTQPALLKAY